MKLLIQSQTSTVQPFKFWEWLTSCRTLYNSCNHLSTLRLMLIPVSKWDITTRRRQAMYTTPLVMAWQRKEPGHQQQCYKHWCIHSFINTVRCRYNAVNFLSNPHIIHPIARPLGRTMGCNLWFDTLIYILLHRCRIKYRVIFDHVITALDCILHHKWT